MLEDFLGLRLAEGTKVGYETGIRFWKEFTKCIGVDCFTRDVNVGVWFTLVRCFGHRVKSQSIKGNFSAIAEFYRNNGHEPVKWSEKSYQIGQIYRVIDKINPPGDKKIAITEACIRIAKEVMDLSVWSQYVLFSCFFLA